jgi:hypothetical protein
MKNFNMAIQECLKRNVIGRGKQNKEKVEVRFFKSIFGMTLMV